MLDEECIFSNFSADALYLWNITEVIAGNILNPVSQEKIL